MLHSPCQQIWKTQQWPQDWKRSVFISVPKKGNAKECSNYHTIVLISRATKVMLKILQAKLPQYMNWELPNVQAGFRKGRGAKDQISNICWIVERAREFQKYLYFCFIDNAKAFDCVDHNKLWKILKKMGVQDLTCLLRNLYVGQEATVRTGHGTADWLKIGKIIWKSCILSLWLFNFYAEYIKWNAGLDESQARIQIARRTITSDMHIDAFELWSWRRLLRVPWTAKRSNQSTLKEITLESPLDCKEIQPVHPKGNQPWIFIGRTDAEAEAPILWPPDVKNWLTGKDPNPGKDLRQEEKGMTGWDGWVASPTQWTWVWVNSRSWWWTARPGML